MTLEPPAAGSGRESPGRGPLAVLLVTGDLLVASRVSAAAAAAGVRLLTRPRPEAVPAGATFDVVILDLQGGHPANAIPPARVLVGGPDRGRVVVFGPHVAEGLFSLAREAGADEAVSRGELLGGFPQLARRWQAAADASGQT